MYSVYSIWLVRFGEDLEKAFKDWEREIVCELISHPLSTSFFVKSGS
jgi:hypothetical protein